jgi:cbb3-type cytochrome oxidase maturation protein
MIYYSGWLFLVYISLIISLVAFLWGLRSGQFSDQERARYLALGKDLLTQPAVAAPRRKQKVYSAALLVVIILGLSAFATALVISIHYR